MEGQENLYIKHEHKAISEPVKKETVKVKKTKTETLKEEKKEKLNEKL